LLNLESAERKAKSNIGKITAGNYLKMEDRAMSNESRKVQSFIKI
jgi:hypothetical protein